MANLPESSIFDAGVYQIETTDPVIGGPSGVTNTPLKNLANRTKYLKDHVDAIEAAYALKVSPAFTGTPTAPTAAAGTNTTQVATTAFVQQEMEADLATATPQMDGVAAVGTSTKLARENHRHPTDTTRAPLASPAFTGTPTAPTAAAGTNTSQIATTAGVIAEILNQCSASGGANGYQKLPSGLIVQWFAASVVNGNSVTFPIAFPNAVFRVYAQHGEGAIGPVYTGIGTISRWQAQLFHSNSGVSGFSFIAIGY